MAKLWRMLVGGVVPAPWDIYSWIVAALPFITAGAAVIAGYVQDFPWMWVIVGAALSFGGAASGLLRFSELRARLRVADKLAFSSGRIAIKQSDADTKEVRLGFELSSSYDYPMTCRVHTISSRIADRVPLASSALPQEFEVPPRGVVWFDDTNIAIEAPRDGTLEGILSFGVDYGRKGGKLRGRIVGKKRIYIGFDSSGKATGGEWNDAA